jgi:hypothetical protein
VTGPATLRTLDLVFSNAGNFFSLNLLNSVPGSATPTGPYGTVFQLAMGPALLSVNGTTVLTPAFGLLEAANVAGISQGAAAISAGIAIYDGTQGGLPTGQKLEFIFVKGDEIDRNLIPEPTSFTTFLMGFLIVGASISRLRRSARS